MQGAITDIDQLDFSKQYSYADYLTWTFSDRVDLIKGWISKMSPASNISVVQPDLCLICDESRLDERGAIGAPDWIIEILSPGNTKKETQVKFELYEDAGVREYWIVQPGDQNILVFDLIGEQYKLRKIYTNEDEVPIGIFPEYNVDFREIFE